MQGTIYTGTYAAGIVLNDPNTQIPATVAAGASIGATGINSAVYGQTGSAWTLSNYGTILNPNNYSAISFASGGMVTNGSAAALIQGEWGVQIYNVAGTVVNSGSIGGLINGVGLRYGGEVTNNTSGTITGSFQAIFIEPNGGSVSNHGLVRSTGSTAAAVELVGGGSVTNSGSIGAAYGGITFLNGIGDFSNSGSLTLNGSVGHAWGVYLGSGGRVTNVAGGDIAVLATFAPNAASYSQGDAAGINVTRAAGTVVNNGSISASGVWHGPGGRAYNIGLGILLASGGSVTNASSASVTALLSAVAITGAGSVVNGGLLLGTVAYGVTLISGGTVTNSQSGTISGGFDGIRAVNAAATVSNDGLLTGPQNYGVRLGANGSLTNSATGRIIGGSDGAFFNLSGAYLSNAGTISGAGTYRVSIGSGVYLGGGGTITNSGTGQITGRLDGVLVKGGAATIDNSATITGTSAYGVQLTGGGVVSNSNVIIGGSIGVDLGGSVAATLTNSGAIGGTTGDAVLFGSADDHLILAPGFSFTHDVDGGGGTNTLELAAGAAAVTGLGTSILNFPSIVFDPGASWLIAGNTTGLSGTISGFAPSDTIDLTGLHETVENYSGTALTLSGDADVTLNLPGAFTTQSFSATTDMAGTGTDITVSCFVEGTRIATESGEVAVESLRVGDRIETLFAGISPIVWLGRRRIECGRHPNPKTIWPVRVRAGAFGNGRPLRDLFLSPDHAVFIGSVLIPIRYLINGASIEQHQVNLVSYYHIELRHHDVILSEGLPTESFLDTGDRSGFNERVSPVRLFLDFAGHIREAGGCAQLCVVGPEVEAARRMTRDRWMREPREFSDFRRRANRRRPIPPRALFAVHPRTIDTA